MKRFYEVEYEPEGSVTKTDKVFIWANTIKGAIEEFENTEINYGSDIRIKYSQHAIKNIRVC